MKRLNIILAVLLLLCLFKMPYGVLYADEAGGYGWVRLYGVQVL